MNILKYSFVTFLILVAVFFGIGLINPGFSYEWQVEINADVGQSWDVFTDRNRMKDWMLELEEVRLIKETQDHVGDQFVFVFRQNGEEVVVTETVTAYRKGEYYEFHLETEALSADTEIYFSESGEGTTLTGRTKVVPVGLVQRSLFFLIQDTFKEQADIQYGLLKETIERAAK